MAESAMPPWNSLLDSTAGLRGHYLIARPFHRLSTVISFTAPASMCMLRRADKQSWVPQGGRLCQSQCEVLD
ncbi:predicted protein [Botrytis cinerea T4]|uniref:Uncharacterized protein n=1 Tax=Botryotinia fuckeliana (strain T4) TaxID=999810 RepID=G2YCY5_BOTF4|nr:predicted protein [Botrytis cinerea T4]